MKFIRNNFKKNLQNGFTLVEVLVSIAVLGFIVMSVSGFQSNILRFNRSTTLSLDSARYAQSILRTIVRELRTAKPGDDGSYPILQAGTSTITFFSDINSDGRQEKIRYFVEEGVFQKGVTQSSGLPVSYLDGQEEFHVLAERVYLSSSTPLFQYYDGLYTGTSTPLADPVVAKKVRLIKINLIIRNDQTSDAGDRLYTSQVMLRNLKDSL